MSSRRKKMSRMRIRSVWRKVSRKRRRKKPQRSRELKLESPRARRRASLAKIWT